MGLDELRRKHAALSDNTERDLADMRNIVKESGRVENIAHNVESIVDDIDARFEQLTLLNNTDITFLFFATMLQTLRWVLLPELRTHSILIEI